MRKTNIIFMSILLVVSVVLFFFYTNPIKKNNNVLQKDNSYVINNYDTEIIVNENNSLQITENITVEFLKSGKHGIFRNLPIINSIKYEENNKIITEDYRVKYSSVSATKLVEQYEEKENLILVLGDERRTFSEGDTFTFVIKYLLTIGEDKNKDFDQFYFNILGDGWPVDIVNFKATVKFFKDITGTKIYEYFKDETEEFVVSGNAISISKSNISYGNPITLRAKFDNGFFVTKNVNLNYYIIFGCVILMGIISLLIYLKGTNKNIIIPVVEFKAPDGISPSVCGYIIDRYVDDKDLASLIVYFANKGFLKINSEDKNKIKLEKLKDVENVKSYEKEIFDAMFKDDNIVVLSDVGEKIYTKVEKAKLKIQKENDAKYFKDDVASYYLITFLPLLMLVIMGVYVGYKSVANFLSFTLVRAFIIVLIISTFVLINAYQKRISMKKKTFNLIKITTFVLISISLAVYITLANNFFYDKFFGKLFAAIIYLATLFLSLTYNERTNEGNKITGRLLGLKQFILTAEKDRLEFLCKENPYMFFDILPYAYVFGISDIWIKKFESIIIKMPPSYNFDCDIVDVLIMNNICNSMNSVNSSLRDFRAKTIASKVSKTVASGAKGGRSGGGFSGGGFGGGGGGSW